MIDIPSYHRGISNAKTKDLYSLPDNAYVRKVIWQLQKGLASTGCVVLGIQNVENNLAPLK
eukprot:12062082-Heterocapsa_arctica.AAC.1